MAVDLTDFDEEIAILRRLRSEHVRAVEILTEAIEKIDNAIQVMSDGDAADEKKRNHVDVHFPSGAVVEVRRNQS